MSHLFRRFVTTGSRHWQATCVFPQARSASNKPVAAAVKPHQDVVDLSGFQDMFDMKSSPALVQATTQSSPRAIIDPFSTRSVENFEAKLAKIPSDLSKRKQFRQLQPSHGLMQRLTQLRIGRTKEKNKPQSDEFLNRRDIVSSKYLWSRRLKFISASRHPSTLPPASIDAREVAFAGRSNVGKSSLVNRLTKSSPAVAENKPGVTQKLSFYDIVPQRRVVDLPGYGFAFTSDKRQELWEQTIKDYLATRTALKRVFVLIDGRHGIKQNDRDFLEYLETSTSCRYQLVLTKCDMVPRDELARRIELTLHELATRWPQAIPTIIPVVVRAGQVANIGAVQAEVLASLGLLQGLMANSK